MHTKQLIEFVESITTRPSMWVGYTDYESVTAFLCGYDFAVNGGFLGGYHEWLTMKFERGHNLGWSALLRFETLKRPIDQNENLTEQDNELLLNSLRESLIEYLNHRETIGLRNVYFDHGMWLRQFEWFDENVERYGCSSDPEQQGSTDSF